jgi:RNA polymerase sigma-70 factor (ECF subfamily)
MSSIVEKSSLTLGSSLALAGAAAPSANRVTDRANAAMDRYAAGDDSAFADVYDTVGPRVHAFLLRQTRSRISADDLLQQTLLQMHRKRGTYESGLPVLPWAFAIARRLYIDELRRRKTDALWSARGVEEDDHLASSSPHDELASLEVAARVEAELSRMPKTQRAAFELLKVEGLSHQEAARALGTTVSAVKLRAFRAYATIRAVLASPAKQRRTG